MLIITEKHGRLANRLILASHLVAFSSERGVPLMNLSLDEYAAYFEGPARDLFCRFPARRSWIAPTQARRRLVFRVAAGLCRRLEQTPLRRLVLRLAPSQDCALGTAPRLQTASRPPVFLAGYGFRHHAGLAAQRPVLREYFRPVPEVWAEVRPVIDIARQDCDLLIGVHIRHGDYRTWENGRWFFSVAQYAQIMLSANAIFDGRVRFLACSDEAQDAAEFAGLSVTWGPGGAASDLFALAECDRIIGPQASTYARWAAFYGGVPLYAVSKAEQPVTPDCFQVPREING